MRVMTAERAANEIKRAYEVTRAVRSSEWMGMTRLAGMVDLTKDELTEGVRHLMRNDDRFNVVPESNQKTLTAADRRNALHIGCQDLHLICWF